MSSADERVADWPLMQSYTPTLVLSAAYLAVIWLGIRWMKNREPLNLRWVLVAYNAALVLLNFHIFFEVSFMRMVSLCGH